MRIGCFLSIKKKVSAIRATPRACLMTIKHEMSRFDTAAPAPSPHSSATSGQVRAVWEPAGHVGGGLATIPDRNARNYHYEAMNGLGK